MKFVQLLIRCTSVTAICVASASPAWGQETTADSSAAPSVSDDEIVVTALKRSQNIQDVPISMTVLDGEQLGNFNQSDFQALQGSVPGLFIQTSTTNQGLYLRGFGSAPANPAFDQSVSLFQDGLYFGRARQFMAPFFDIERIEVLRGPQGALLGKNTAAGAISIVTANPTSTFEGSLTGSYNFSRDGVETSGYVSGPISEDLGVRLAVRYKNVDGYLDNIATGTKDPSVNQLSGRLTLRYAPAGGVEVISKLEAARSRVDGTAANYVPALGPYRLRRVKNAPLPFGEPEGDNQNGLNFGTTINIPLGEHTLTSVTGYSHFKSATLSGAAALNPQNLYVAWRENFDQWSQELRLVSPTGGAFDYIVGVYYDKVKDRIYQQARYNLFGGAINGQYSIDFRQRTSSLSTFAQGTLHLADDLRLLGSLRYTHIAKTGQSERNLDFGNSLSGEYGVIAPVKIKEDHFDPSVTLQFDINRDVMVYATYARGSKAGGFASTNATVDPGRFTFRPERSENIEIGTKSEFFDRRVTLNISAFRMRFHDLQVSSYVAPTGLQTSNAASATSTGVEASLSWRPIPEIRFSAAGAYIDAKYDDFPGAPCRATQPASVCSTTAPVGAPNNQANNNAKGIPLNFTPKWSGEFQTDITIPLSSGLALSFTGVAKHRGRVWIDTAYSPVYGIEPAHTKFDARIALNGEDDRWSIALVGTNLTNKLTAGQTYLWPLETGPGGQRVAGAFIDEGRTISAQATVRF